MIPPNENPIPSLKRLAEEQELAGPENQPPDFAAVVNQHWTAVYKLLYTLTGNTHDSEDLSQETFLRALNRLDSFQAGTKMRAWLLRIATNAFFDVRRKRKRADSRPLPDDVPGAGKHPGHSLEVKEESELLKIALGELTELTRLVFHLRAQEDLSFKEIADLAGTTEQAARWHMHQARSKLLGRMGERRAPTPRE